MLKIGNTISMVFKDREYDTQGWLEYFTVSFSGPNLSCQRRISSPSMGTQPSQLIKDLAKNWRGWKGKKGWSALDGELELEALSDSLGHVYLSCSLPNMGADEFWETRIQIIVEAGALEELANASVNFFETRKLSG